MIKNVHFNVDIYTCRTWYKHFRTSISKHLMLLFNRNDRRRKCFLIRISKHLMLLFNSKELETVEKMVTFQNISCYCLTVYLEYFLCWNTISKHLMLLFNCTLVSACDRCLRFQNISCYCLTSRHTGLSVSILRFQNISCYCLT